MWDPPNLQNLEEKLAGSFAYCVAYCVAEISERLFFPANSNRKDAGAGYKSLALDFFLTSKN